MHCIVFKVNGNVRKFSTSTLCGFLPFFFFLQCEAVQCKQVYDLDAAYMLKLYAYTWDHHEMW